MGMNAEGRPIWLKDLFKKAIVTMPFFIFWGIDPFIFLPNWKSDGILIAGVALINLGALGLTWVYDIYLLILYDRKKISLLTSILLFYAYVILVYLVFIALYKDHILQVRVILFFAINGIAQNSTILLLTLSTVNEIKKKWAENEVIELKLKNMEAEFQLIAQKLQPHFLFNSLNVLKYLIRTNSDQAESYLIKLSEFLRVAVSSNTPRNISLREEVDFTFAYIDLQKVRFEDGFKCQIDIPNNALDSYEIPIFSIQTLVENALKHNIFSSASPLLITISYRNGRVAIKNNRQPKLSSASVGFGLDSLSKRFKILNDSDIEIVATEQDFTVVVPLKSRDNA